MKTPKLIELERDRLTIMEEARSLLHDLEGETDEKKARELERKHDSAMRSLDANKLDIEEEQMNARDEDERNSRRPGSNGSVGGSDDGSSDFARAWGGEGRGEWIDEKGNAVRVLENTDRFSDTRQRGNALGDTVRAMVTGARNDTERRALSEGTDSAGGYTVPTPLASWFIDRLRSQSVAVRAGARTVPMESQTLAIARLETDPTIGWRAENASIAEGDPTFGAVTLTAKSLAGILKVSRELMADSLNVGEMIENALAQTMALEMDRAAIWGSGSSNQPRGVVNTVGINSVSMGTNGAALTDYDALIDAIYELHADNVPNPTAGIHHPRTGRELAKLKDADNNPLGVPGMVSNIPLLSTTAAPIDDTQGTATDASSIVYGDYRQMFLGMRESINIRILDQLYADSGQIGILVHARMDVQLAQPKAFCELAGIIPPA
ncbi:phage major capsid protein [Qipengyuania seohaensis]|uniref:phage major capsid protein n=1 Tax=Qipengyuania seohaensis TaxID=266951 RepID=UPI0012FE686F|nr:phage major capsid protein [Qipengyuania seohaensis]